MTHDPEVTELMRAIGEKSLQLLHNLQGKQTSFPDIIRQYLELSENYLSYISTLLKNPEKILAMQMAYMQDAVSLAQEQFNSWMKGEPLAVEDKRFSSEEWVNNPFFNLLSQHYLLATEHFNNLLGSMDYENTNEGRKIKFFISQILDALSPANYLHTNPQLMAETVQSHGKNLLKGLHNLLNDFDHGSASLIIKMTDMNAFSVGKNIAVTPGKVVFRNRLIELIQYTPQTEKVKNIPLLMIPPWINKYYILDLSPSNSLVNYLVSQGITVFIISWINPDAKYADVGFFDYLNEGPHAAIEVIKDQCQVKEVNALGFCIGGTLLATLLGYYKATGNNSINSATYLASLLDFSDPGDISVYIDEQQIQELEKQMHAKGFLDGKFMAASFNSLRANDLIWSFFVKNYLQGKTPVPFDILYWNADSTNMPALMHSQYLRWMYLHNNLVKPGKIHLNHVPIDITELETPSFFLSTHKDHIAPWQTTYLGYSLMKGPKRFVLGGSGHIAGIVNPPGANKYNYYTNNSSPLSPKDWFEHAIEHKGSWWPEWLKWLKSHSGKLIKAVSVEQLPHKGLCDAPGQYVLKD